MYMQEKLARIIGFIMLPWGRTNDNRVVLYQFKGNFRQLEDTPIDSDTDLHNTQQEIARFRFIMGSMPTNHNREVLCHIKCNRRQPEDKPIASDMIYYTAPVQQQKITRFTTYLYHGNHVHKPQQLACQRFLLLLTKTTSSHILLQKQSSQLDTEQGELFVFTSDLLQ